jgi:hypothetical protein
MDALESQMAQLDALDSMVEVLVEMPADMAVKMPTELPAQDLKLEMAGSEPTIEMSKRFVSDCE